MAPHGTLAPVMPWPLIEAVVGLLLVVVASAVIVRPAYRRGRFLLGLAVASWAVGIAAVLDGLTR